jgi:aminoglycoside phosphotransferase (APT) family kinase protein
LELGSISDQPVPLFSELVDSSIAWLNSPSQEELGRAIGQVMPKLPQRSLLLKDRVVTNDPRYFQGSAILDGSYVIKFAWSEIPARRIVHEGRVLAALAEARRVLAIPALVATSTAPALLVTKLVRGEPLSWKGANEVKGDQRLRLVEGLAGFLALLHDQATLSAVQNDGIGLEMPLPQATTSEIRSRFGKFVKRSQFALVDQWCDWAEEILAEPSGTSMLHGDLHGYNVVWDPQSGALQLVADFESAGAGDPAFDFRYLPGQADTADLFCDVVARYEEINGGRLNLQRVMAWHIRTVLGDALWRTEANVPLPGGGGTASSWVDELQIRLRAVLG